MRVLLLLMIFSQCVFADTNHAYGVNNAVTVSQDAIHRNQIKVLTAGPQTLHITHTVLGKIVPDANKTIYLYPRYNGIIQKLTKQLGDKVKQGELLATIESDHTLQTYPITAPFSGYVVEKNANPGEHVNNDTALYRLSDLSQVWVDLFIYRSKARDIHLGQHVMVYYDYNSDQGQSTQISYVSPLGVEHNQTMLARAVLDNQDGKLVWLPGLYVDTHITIRTQTAPVAVRNRAIQTINEQPVIFVRTKTGFAAKPVIIGLEGEQYTQILSEIKAGEQYAAGQSFLLKAELEKDNVTHSH